MAQWDQGLARLTLEWQQGWSWTTFLAKLQSTPSRGDDKKRQFFQHSLILLQCMAVSFYIVMLGLKSYLFW